MSQKPTLMTDDDPFLLTETLLRHLAGQRADDLKVQETCRQLAKRVLVTLSQHDAALVQENPSKHRATLARALSTALEKDPVTRRLASQLAPEPSPFDRSPASPSRPSDGYQVHIQGNDNIVGNGNVIGDLTRSTKEVPIVPIRILFLTASPDGLENLRTDQEARNVQEALRQSEFRNRFQLIHELAVRLGDFQRTILQHRPEILHFSGHGFGGAISLEGKDGKDWPVEGRDIADLFSILQGKTRCVVLNACYTAEQADLIALKVDTVIARPDAVYDSAARLFSVYFYQALAFGRSVREAFDLACLQLRLEGWESSANPVLLAKRCDPAEVRFA